MSVVGFGALNVDKVMIVDRIPSYDEETFVISIEEHPGGSAANTVVGLARLGIRTGYVGKVGRDAEGEFLLRDLQREGVDTSGVKIGDGRSGEVICIVDREGRRALIVNPGVNDLIAEDDVNLEFINSFEFLHLTSFACAISDLSYKTQRKIVEKVSNQISFDPGMIYASKGMSEMKVFIRNSKVVLPSKREIELLTGAGYVEGAEMLISEGAEIVAVKLGERGCYVTDGKKCFYAPPERVEVVDTTGAGDAFSAGFLYGMLKGKELEECARIANKVAAECIRRRGARDGLPRSI